MTKANITKTLHSAATSGNAAEVSERERGKHKFTETVSVEVTELIY